jgi:prophage antirepressor-like protein
MGNLIQKTFEGKQVRVVKDENGNVLFVGKDVAVALGYSNYRDAINSHCKGVVKSATLQTAGGPQQVRVLTQADVLRLVVSSRLPEAVKFEAWVFEVVLPEIAETGSYGKRKPTTYTEVPSPAVEAIQVAEAISNYLKLEGSARLHMLEQAVKLKAPSFLPMVPAYAIDAPRTADGKLIGDTGSSSLALSATDLLRKVG